VNIDYPLHFDATGRTATTSDVDHIRDMIELVLFTNQGERVNRPDFGSGLLQLVFAPNSVELSAALQFTAKAALQRFLGDLIDVQNLTVVVADASLTVTVGYVIKATQQSASATIAGPAAP
jgi:phage baseplate assembly protein W